MKPNVLLVNLPSIPLSSIVASLSNENKIPHQISMPMGLLYLSGCLKRSGHAANVQMLDYALLASYTDRYDDLEELIERNAREIAVIPDVVGISLLFSTTHSFFEKVISILRIVWPKAKFIVGGIHATHCAPKLLQNPNVDYVIRGEGEIGLVDFIEQVAAGSEIDVKGVYSRKNDLTQPLEMCDVVEDLDQLPFPDWAAIDMPAYIDSLGRKRDYGSSVDRKIATLMTTRGCPFHCTFCSAHTIHGRKMRYRSVENVIAEIKMLHERYGVTLFIPEDDLFTANRARVIKLLKTIKELNIPDCELQFPSALSVNTLDDEIIDALIDAGTRIASIAIESGSEYVQKNVIMKNCNLKKAPQVVKSFQSKGAMTRCYFILGLYSETKEQMRETIEYAKALKADWCVFSLAAPLIGSRMYEQMVESGYFKDDIDIWNETVFTERIFDTPEISAAELKDIVYRANLECNFIHNPNKEAGNYEKAIDIYTDIIHHHPFHTIGWYCIAECYRKMGLADKANEVSNHIKELIANDVRSAEMFSKYNDLMPDFSA